MDIKKILAGEQMPDKNDPRYKEQYEREVEAGRKFANKTKLTLLVMKIQSWANVHRVGFLVIVFGFVISLFALNIINMIRYYKASQNVPHRTVVEQVDQALHQQREIKKAR